MSTTRNQPQRYGGLLGVAGGALGLAGMLTVSTVAFMPSEADAVASFTEDGGRLLGGAQFLVIGAVLIAAFGAIVQRRIRSAAPDSALATMATAGYAMAGALVATSAAGFAGGAVRVDEHDGIAAENATVMFDIGMLLVGGIAPVLLALGIGATAIAVVRFPGVLPTWLGWVGAPIAVGLLILPINYIVFPIAMVWLIAAGVALSSNAAPVVDLTASARTSVAA